MSFFYKRPRGRRRANLQIHYPFNRAAYVRFRLRCWAEARLDGGRALLRGVAASSDAAARGVRRRVRGGALTAASYRRQVRGWLAARPEILAPEAPPE